jgi:hypothetical protein
MSCVTHQNEAMRLDCFHFNERSAEARISTSRSEYARSIISIHFDYFSFLSVIVVLELFQ